METFFLRFYGRTDTDINKCLDEMDIQDIKHRIGDAKVSCNAIIPSTYQPVREVMFYPKFKIQLERIRNNGAKAIYHKWSTPNLLDSTVILREPEEYAFGV